MQTIRFTVFGEAKTAGSKRAFPIFRGSGPNRTFVRSIVTDDNPKSRDWKNAVSSAAGEVYRAELLKGALEVTFRFYTPRPVGHFGSGKNARAVKSSAPARPATRPDVLKLSRAVEDALTGVIWRDDAQVVTEHLEKHFGEPARVEIEISPCVDVVALPERPVEAPVDGPLFEEAPRA